MKRYQLIGEINYLIDNQNPDGGWGYYLGKNSYVEPTCFSLLFFHSAQINLQAIKRGLKFLLSLQTESGGFRGFTHDHEISWTTSLVLLTLRKLNVAPVNQQKAAHWLLHNPGRKIQKKSKIIELNMNLQGWPWYPDTFSWIEPTSWALIALKSYGIKGKVIDEAESLIVDRVCTDGGWNYGNKRVYDKNLSGYIIPTVLSLMALQGRGLDSIIAGGFDFLQRNTQKQKSPLNLSFAILALHLFNRETLPLPDELYQMKSSPKRGWEGNNYITAMALLALFTLNRKNPFKIEL